MSARVFAELRGRRVTLEANQKWGGGLVLEVLQYSRRESKLDVHIEISLDDARLFLRQWQGAVDEAYRRAKEEQKALEAAARELEP